MRRLIELDKGADEPKEAIPVSAPPKPVTVENKAIPEPAIEQKPAAAEAAPSVEPAKTPQHRYDTLLRFAAVELEGSVKN